MQQLGLHTDRTMVSTHLTDRLHSCIACRYGFAHFLAMSHLLPPPPRAQDVVELQLLREVASRSSSFFQAASTLQGLQGHLSEAVGCIRGLRQELAEADANMYSTAAAVKGLQARRENLQDTLDITKVLLRGVT